MTRFANATKAPTRATAVVGCALVLLTASLLFVPMNLRDVGILLNRDDYVRDEFEVDYFSQGRKSNTFGGHVVSSGESLSTYDEGIIISGGLARRQQLIEDKLLVGHRFPVWYLPATGFWRFVDKINQFRVISPDEFESSTEGRLVWLGTGVAFWVTGILLMRWGVTIAREASKPNTTSKRARANRR